MTALLLTACVGMITGAFLIFRISPMDFTLGVFRRLTAGPKSIRDEINETTHRKKPGFFRREICSLDDHRTRQGGAGGLCCRYLYLLCQSGQADPAH